MQTEQVTELVRTSQPPLFPRPSSLSSLFRLPSTLFLMFWRRLGDSLFGRAVRSCTSSRVEECPAERPPAGPGQRNAASSDEQPACTLHVGDWCAAAGTAKMAPPAPGCGRAPPGCPAPPPPPEGGRSRHGLQPFRSASRSRTAATYRGPTHSQPPPQAAVACAARRVQQPGQPGPCVQRDASGFVRAPLRVLRGRVGVLPGTRGESVHVLGGEVTALHSRGRRQTAKAARPGEPR